MRLLVLAALVLAAAGCASPGPEYIRKQRAALAFVNATRWDWHWAILDASEHALRLEWVQYFNLGVVWGLAANVTKKAGGPLRMEWHDLFAPAPDRHSATGTWQQLEYAPEPARVQHAKEIAGD